MKNPCVKTQAGNAFPAGLKFCLARQALILTASGAKVNLMTIFAKF